MIEINVAAKPKPIPNAVALMIGDLYILKNGMVILILGPNALGRVIGRVMYIPPVLPAGTNQHHVAVGNSKYSWNTEDGTFYTQENNHNYCMHVRHKIHQGWLDGLIAAAPAAPGVVVVGVAHENEPRDVLWAHWKAGGMLQWKSKNNNAWKSYYDHHNQGVDAWLHLHYGAFNIHYEAYHIRRKP